MRSDRMSLFMSSREENNEDRDREISRARRRESGENSERVGGWLLVECIER